MGSMKIFGRIVALVFLAGVLVTGCGASSAGRMLTIGTIKWTENEAVANLTKVLLEDELGYDDVQLQLIEDDPKLLFQGVAEGDLHAFQDVWLPNHSEILAEVGDRVEHLHPWYRGTTRFSMAAPSYMGIDSIDEINTTGATEIYGIEPGSVIMQKIPNRTIPEYGLKQQLVAAGTPAMLLEVNSLYRNKEDFVFVAWSPHWMNQEYDFTYLKDPKGSLGNLTEPAKISTIVRKNLKEDDPAAYAFLDALTLTEDQINSLELEIKDADDPAEGVKRWLEDNDAVADPWISAARQAREG
ncbi:MAG: glycine betaine ABC transporter substrate-binding protein [Rubrobacter sp.]|nr:glycine betaine ABC transporter substrate-binding protein [Rubrobacter sp.]